MFHLSAYYELVDPAGAQILLNAVQEQVVTVTGDDIRVPKDLPFLIAQAVLINDIAIVNLVQIQSPSLRSTMNVDVQPIINGAVFGSPPEGMFHPLSPIPLTGDESINFAVTSNPVAAAAHYGLIWFGDGPQAQVNGEIFTVRVTSAIAQAVGAWVNGNLVFTQTLPVGNYDIVGMRTVSTDGVVSRLVFVGGTWRPGVPVVNLAADLDPYWTRYGGLGILGSFHTNTPPTVDMLGGVATAQTHFFDLIRRG